MHAIDATSHTREPTSRIDRQQPSSVLNSWGSQVQFDEQFIHDSTKPVHGFKAGALTHLQVLVEDIIRHSIRKHTNSCEAFLVRGES
jgi:hypothetical protein